MQKPSPHKNQDPFPLNEMMESADEVHVSEVSIQNKNKINTALDRFVRDCACNQDDEKHRAFLVFLKPKAQTSPPRKATNQANISQDRDYVLKNAELLLKEKDFVLARTLFSFLLEKNPKDKQALKGLGNSLLSLGETASAKKCFQALWDNFQYNESLFWLGQCYYKEDDNQNAIKYFERARQFSDLNTSTLFCLYKDYGNCLAQTGHLDEAAGAYHKALAIKPHSSHVYVNLGTLEIQRKHYNLGLDFFEKAISFDPKNARAYCGIGIIASAKNELDHSVDYFCKALDLNSQSLVAIFQLLEVSYKKDDFSKIKQRLFKFLEKQSDNDEVRFALASLLFKEGSWGACEKNVDKILEKNPKFENAIKLKSELTANKHRS